MSNSGISRHSVIIIYHLTSVISLTCVSVLICQVWVTLHGGTKCVVVYDSMAGTASEETQKTVRVLVRPRARVQFNHTCTQQTQGSGDCGCYALAYATTIVLGGSCFECCYGFRMFTADMFRQVSGKPSLRFRFGCSAECVLK